MSPSALGEVFVREGLRHDAGGHQPLWLHDLATAWYLEAGTVDVFLVPVRAGEAAGSRVHLFQAKPGQVLFALGPGEPPEPVGFLAQGSPDLRLHRLPLARLEEMSADPPGAVLICQGVDQWIQSFYRALSQGLRPPEAIALVADQEIELEDLDIAQPSAGVLWARHLEGESRLVGLPDLLLGRDLGAIPLTPDVWLEVVHPAKVVTVDTITQARQGALWTALPSFEALVRKWANLVIQQRAAADATRLEAKAQFQQATLQSAAAHLSEPLVMKTGAAPGPIAHEDPLLGACHLVSEALGISLEAPLGATRGRISKDPLERWAKAARLRLRRVMLRDDWWLQDNGPMLAYARATKRPVALLPTSPTRYALVDPVHRSRQVVTAEAAQSLDSQAYTFHRSFPGAALTAWSVFRFGLQHTQSDLVMILLMSLAGGLLGTAFPLAMGLVVDTVIPSSAKAQLVFLSLGLLAAACASAVFELTRGIALVRLETKSDTAIQGAIWDRLLSLPVPFFRRFTAGDLAVRANGISAIRRILSGAVITSVLSGVFSVFNFGLLFYFSAQLALVATVMMFVSVGVTLLVSVLSLRLQRPLYETEGKIAGLVLQLIAGITKLRVAGGELHAYAVWAKAFARQKKIDLQVTALANRLTVFSDAFPLLTSMCLFAAVAFWDQPGLSTGRFLAFTAAFMTFLYAGLEAGDALISLLNTIPLYERAQPILQTLPEVSALKLNPGELRGKVELQQVSFRYQPESPLVLRRLSLQAEPGEFVAVVGPSGAGKSTLLRLLLGFETPESGTIRYDGLDLAGLDSQAVRRQIGVVLQHGKVMPGDIFENIVGSAAFTLDEAWEAARSAGLEPDIQEMPMGMHTVIGEGGGTLSGGQRQRLMIARAIVGKPRIVFFDEATSALDNRTQAIVNRSLEQLGSTRIVIAHRLSTILNADRIYVLQAGELVQTGSYRALLEQPGPFAEWARRQMPEADCTFPGRA